MSLSTNVTLLRIAQERNAFRSFPFVVVFVFIMRPQGCLRRLFYDRLTRESRFGFLFTNVWTTFVPGSNIRCFVHNRRR